MIYCIYCIIFISVYIYCLICNCSFLLTYTCFYNSIINFKNISFYWNQYHKKLNVWNELVEKVNTDFDENRKEFWVFVGRKSKGKKKNIA